MSSNYCFPLNEMFDMQEMYDHGFAPEQIVGHIVSDVIPLQLESNGEVAIPDQAIINEFRLTNKNLSATLVMKTKPYTNRDCMIVVVNKSEENFIETIEDLSGDELEELLKLANEASSVGASEGDTRFISINAHRSNSYGDAEGAVPKPGRAQTLRNLHIHAGVVDAESISPLNRKLERKERDDIFDPMTSVIGRLLKLPSVESGLFNGLSIKYIGMCNGNINFEKVDVNNGLVANDLIVLQKRMHSFYDQFYSCFRDESSLLDYSDRAEKIELLFNGIKRDNDENFQEEINGVHRFFTWLNGKLKDSPSKDDRMFLEGFATTTVLTNKYGEKLWQLMLAPRIISTGNALHAMGLVKTLVEAPEEFLESRLKYINGLRALRK